MRRAERDRVQRSDDRAIGPGRLDLVDEDVDRRLQLVQPALRHRASGDQRLRTIEFEAGGEWMSRELAVGEEKINRYWFSLAYRVGF